MLRWRASSAMGRALAIEPEVLLFDEPLSALDDDTRHEMHELIRRIRGQLTVTELHVTALIVTLPADCTASEGVARP